MECCSRHLTLRRTRRSLFWAEHKGGSKTMLNAFFFYVFSKVSSWQSMSEFHVTTLDKVTELILNSTYQALSSSKSGPEMPQVASACRYFLEYLTSFAAIAPFFRTGNPRITSRTNKFFGDDKTFSAYLHRKATAWYLRFPPVHSPDRVDDTQKVLVKNLEGPEDSVRSRTPRPVMQMTWQRCAPGRPILSEAEDASDEGAQE